MTWYLLTVSDRYKLHNVLALKFHGNLVQHCYASQCGHGRVEILKNFYELMFLRFMGGIWKGGFWIFILLYQMLNKVFHSRYTFNNDEQIWLHIQSQPVFLGQSIFSRQVFRLYINKWGNAKNYFLVIMYFWILLISILYSIYPFQQ